MALKFGQVLYVDFEYDIDKLEATNKDIAATYRRDFPMYRRMSVDANLICIKEWLRINERAVLSHADSTPPTDLVMTSVLEKYVFDEDDPRSQVYRFKEQLGDVPWVPIHMRRYGPDHLPDALRILEDRRPVM